MWRNISKVFPIFILSFVVYFATKSIFAASVAFILFLSLYMFFQFPSRAKPIITEPFDWISEYKDKQKRIEAVLAYIERMDIRSMADKQEVIRMIRKYFPRDNYTDYF